MPSRSITKTIRACSAFIDWRPRKLVASLVHGETKFAARSLAWRARVTGSVLFQRHASVGSCDDVCSERVVDKDSDDGSINDTIDSIARSPQNRNVQAWADILETYLPTRLRIGVQGLSGKISKNAGVRRIYTLPLLLAKAKGMGKVDLLSHVGLHQGRWEAVIWLVDALIENYTADAEIWTRQSILSDTPWKTNESLDQISDNPIAVDLPRSSQISVDILTALDNHHMSARRCWRRRLGQIWQSLGCMVLHAEDRLVNDPKSDSIMPHVLQILAQLHQKNVLPPSMYNYEPSSDPFVLRRPPTIYLLSARIMTAMTDVAWNNWWRNEMEKAKTYGYELAPPRVQPQSTRVGAEVWLDLILWACVEGGYVEEGARIIAELEERRSKKNLEWSVISWEEMCQKKTPQLSWTAVLKLQLDRSRVNQATGIQIANHGVSQVEMGERTISQEVVEAVLDGIINMASANTKYGGIPTGEVQEYVTTCKRLLERHHPLLEDETLNAVILRLVESAVLGSDGSPGVLKRLLDLKPTKIEKSITGGETSLAQSPKSFTPNEMDFSAFVLGLLHKNLHDFAQAGNFQGTLLTFRRIQELIDQNRNIYIEEFAAELKARLQSRDRDSQLYGNNSRRASPLLNPQIPVATLVALFDLINNSKEIELGKWLLYNDDIDGGIIEPSIFSEPSLQPALLRFATVFADDQLLARVLENLKPPLSASILHGLLRCQTVLCKWDAVQGVLEHFQQTRGMDWTAGDAIAIAASVLNLECGAKRSKSKSTLRGVGLLRDLLQGRYDSPQDPSKPPNRQQTGLAYQLRQIIRSAPGISNYFPYPEDSTQFRPKMTKVHPAAFNILLEATVENYGSFAGRDLWQNWCRAPRDTGAYDRRLTGTIKDTPEPVVRPTPYMLRTIIRPVVQKLKHKSADVKDLNVLQDGPGSFNECSRDRQEPLTNRESLVPYEDRSILDWGHSMLKKFGLSQKEINAEIPPTLLTPRRARPAKPTQ